MTFQTEADSATIAHTGGLTRAHSKQASLRVYVWSDLIAVFIAAFIALGLDQTISGPNLPQWIGFSALSTFGYMLWLRSKGHYRLRKGMSERVREVLHGSVICALIVCALELVRGAEGLNLSIVAQWALTPVLMIAFRSSLYQVLTSNNAWLEPVTVLAPREQIAETFSWLGNNPGLGLKPTHFQSLESLAALDDRAIKLALAKLENQPIFLAPDEAHQTTASTIASRLSALGVNFYYRPSLGRITSQSLDLLDAPPSDGLVLHVQDSLNRPLAKRAKRGFDVIASAAALASLSPLLMVIAWLIRQDGGQALFAQPRAGQAGQTFHCLKFRTMVVDAEAKLEKMLGEDPLAKAEWDQFQKLTRDPRITPVGHFLRKTSLDELPQLINVLRGQMSLIGPRPMLLSQKEIYGPSLDAYERMRPGLTGLWQVNGRNITTFEERARLDDWYARNWSLWRDIVILVRTVREVVLGGGR